MEKNGQLPAAQKGVNKQWKACLDDIRKNPDMAKEGGYACEVKGKDRFISLA